MQTGKGNKNFFIFKIRFKKKKPEFSSTNHRFWLKPEFTLIIHAKIVEDWIDKYKKDGEASIKDTYSRAAYKLHDDKILEKEYKKLLEDLLRTKAENEYLKKSFPQVLKRSKQSKKK